MQNNKAGLMDKKTRRGRFFDVLFASSLPFALLIGLLWNLQIRAIGGAAIGGKIENGLFFVVSNSGGFRSVTSSEWVLSLILACFTLLGGFLVGCGFIYFGVKYFFYPYFKSRRKGNTL
jgi:hypothetical protein